jgi:hypothetical protein
MRIHGVSFVILTNDSEMIVVPDGDEQQTMRTTAPFRSAL